MPDVCSAFGCSNRRNARTKEQGITFHTCHFKPEDFDTTGQTTRLREGVVPSIFAFPRRFGKAPSKPRLSRTSQKAAAECPDVHVQPSQNLKEPVSVPSTPSSSRTPQNAPAVCPDVRVQLSQNPKESTSDHQYALDPVKIKKTLIEAQAMVEKLHRDLRNAKDRERRHKRTVQSLLEDLKQRNMVTEELQQKLDFYSGLLDYPDPPL